MSEKVNLNIGYMVSKYKDYTKNQTNYASPSIPFSGTDIYSRTNKAFAFGVDYKF